MGSSHQRDRPMKIKIEDKPVLQTKSASDKRDFRGFVQALKDMEKGQSFLWQIVSTDRIAISVVGMLLDRRYVARKEGDQHRIGRVL
jgi:hypothetical protein